MQVTDRESANGPVSITIYVAITLQLPYLGKIQFTSLKSGPFWDSYHCEHSSLGRSRCKFAQTENIKKPMEHQHHQHLMARSTNFLHVQSLFTAMFTAPQQIPRCGLVPVKRHQSRSHRGSGPPKRAVTTSEITDVLILAEMLLW